jgi:hypothetical protein
MFNQKLEKELLALYDSDRNFILKILNYNLDIPLNITDDNGNTLLHLMIINKDLSGVSILLKYINSLDSDQKVNLLNMQNNQMNTPAHIAVVEDLQDIVKKLDNMGADLTIANEDGFVIKSSSESESNFENDQTPRENNIDNIINKFFKSNKSNKLNEQTQDNKFNLTSISSSEIPQLVPDPNIQSRINRQQISNRQSIPDKQIYSDKTSENVDTGEFINFIKNQKNQRNQNGGNQNSEQLLMKGSRLINNELQNKIKTETDSLGIYSLINNQNGGKKSKKSKKSKSSKKYKSSRSNSPNAPDLHVEVIEIIKKIVGNEDDARYIKAGLYQKIKDNYPNLSSNERSKKLKELATVDEINKMKVHLPKLKEAVEKAREKRRLEKDNNPTNKSTNKPTNKPTTKPTDKSTTKPTTKPTDNNAKEIKSKLKK